jgi:histidine ammonia-lyase
VPKEIVKLMLLLKIQSLGYGHSGIQLQTVNRLVAFFNNDILPVIYTQGSLGLLRSSAVSTSIFALLGEGEVYFEDAKVHSSVIMERFDWQPIVLQSKKDWLLNGTQFMSAYGMHILMKANKFFLFSGFNRYDILGSI